jgi:hypothetical protein
VVSATPSPTFRAIGSDGVTVAWSTWDGAHAEHLTLRWQNEAWTAEGLVGRDRVHYVLRLGTDFQVRQLLLFRDLEEPDLWLATDGAGRWGEVNGAHRTDLDGCTLLRLPCTPFTHLCAVRQLPLAVGHTARVRVAVVDVDTLAVVPTVVEYSRLDERRWSWRSAAPRGNAEIEFAVDDHGLVVDEAGCYRRVSSPDSQDLNASP